MLVTRGHGRGKERQREMIALEKIDGNIQRAKVTQVESCSLSQEIPNSVRKNENKHYEMYV